MHHHTSRRFPRLVLGLTLAAGVALATGHLVAAGQRATTAGSALPRTPDGRPDLQGIWNNSTQTPLQRPAALGAKQFYTDEELAKLRLRDHDQKPADGDPGTYNQFWWEEGGLLKQTSLIVDPPDGRIPPLTAEGERRRRERMARGGERDDNPEDRNLAERCITRGAPKLPGGYNNHFQIVQTPQYLAIEQEMIHDVRIIPLDARPHAPAAVRSFLGDSRARWEGDTLVVETTNFRRDIDETSYNCCGNAGEGLTIVERFTLLDKDTIDYRYTVNDPTIFTRPWTVSLPMRRAAGPIYEYACHEGNHAMVGILRGGRAMEKKKAATTEQGARN
ncbi:MAG TPA: hypothetical protein VH417_13825 [Vicinamibacterales bacterium]